MGEQFLYTGWCLCAMDSRVVLLCKVWHFPNILIAMNSFSDTPENCRHISSQERKFLSKLEKPTTNSASVPWKNIMISIPFWALMLTHFAHNYLLCTLLTLLPMYLKKVHMFDISTSGFILSIPHICMWICITLQAKLAHYIYSEFFNL